MSERIVIAGASGFIGTYLAARYRAQGATVSLIGRRGRDASWGDTPSITRLLDGASLLINMAGKSVNCRYTAANRAEIMRSRIETTRELSAALAVCAMPPPLWINSSTATIYRHAEDRAMTESTGEIGAGFSVGIATAWERELFAPDLPTTRRVALRMAIVLGDGSALVPLIRLAKFGIGGAQLDGRWFRTRARMAAGTLHEFGARGGHQKFSWIHIADVFGIIEHLRERPGLSGAINASSPKPTDNVSMMATLRRVLGVRFGIPAPRLVLEIGTAVIRSETELVLKSRWVVPETVMNSGYEFEHPELEEALRDVIESR